MKINKGFCTSSRFKKNEYFQKYGYLLYRDSMRGNVLVMDYGRPVSLKRALINVRDDQNINEGIIADKNVINRFITDLQDSKKTKKILNRKIIKLVGYGSCAAAFETADGKIIKITDGNHIPMNRSLEFFDVPVFKKGKSGKTHFYVEEKLYQHAMPEYWVGVIKDAIRRSGYRTSDLYEHDMHQIGISKKGRLYLLDAECARYKTIFHAMFDKIKRYLMKKL